MARSAMKKMRLRKWSIARGTLQEDGEPTTHQLGWYVRNCARSPAAGRLERVMLERLEKLKDIEDGSGAGDDEARTESRDARRRRRLHELSRVLASYASPPSGGEEFERNARYAREEFDLDDLETEILLLLLRYERNGDLECFADEVLGRLRSLTAALAALLCADREGVRDRIVANGALLQSGLLCIDEDNSGVGLGGSGGNLRLAESLRKIMFRAFASRDEWASAIVGPPVQACLAWEDFEHLGSIRELAAQIMAGAGRANARGINLLFHGPVGTGKTEFCKVLGARAGMGVWAVGETGEEDREPERSERLASLRLAQRLLSRRGDAVILFDEGEDLLCAGDSLFGFLVRRNENGSKVYLNRLVEQNAVPVLWTCNDVSRIDPAVLRRMTLALEIRTPNPKVRARIWGRVLKEQGVELDASAVARLASRYEAPPAVAANAARVVSLAGGGEAEIEQAMSGVLQILGLGPRVCEADGSDFDVDLVNCSENVEALRDRLSRPGAAHNWSLCLHGAPGTGKSQFARHLATRLGLEVTHKRASDLLSMWVGESEKQIAAAFAQARASRAMLVIDEADSLLADRRGARQSWEVTQVNEMLTWMENHPLPFVCTTNLMEHLDQASLRRFTFKLRFDSLSPAQAARAFSRFFGAPAPQALPEGLTPGDFATVRRKRELLGGDDPEQLVAWLSDEAAAKGHPTHRIGFAAS
ncbi:MAG TPA: ATP-binding protein [Rhizomicrobium sp.]|jgi:transitional endoplasmic reticulum ATPase|nr:ATP-binding protein [Rhizomicrobium sp.]